MAVSLTKKIDVEPLSDAQWERVERELFAQLDRELTGSPAPKGATERTHAPPGRWLSLGRRDRPARRREPRSSLPLSAGP